MRNRRWGRIGTASALVVATVSVAVLAPTPASACSFAPPRVEVVGEPTAGGTLELAGSNWFHAPGGVNSLCQGTILPLDPVTLVLHFTTLSGPRAVAMTARVDGPVGTVVDQTTYTFVAQAPIPPDATAVDVEVSSQAYEVDLMAAITGAVATTVPPAPTTPAAPATAAPANAVSGSPSFTG